MTASLGFVFEGLVLHNGGGPAMGGVDPDVPGNVLDDPMVAGFGWVSNPQGAQTYRSVV